MPYISQEQHAALSQNLAITANTILGLMQGVEVKSTEKSSNKALLLMLGCIGMALTIQADIALATAEKGLVTLSKAN
jgi:hypothetical protein